MERDTHSFYSGFSICPHPTCVAPATRPLAWLRKAKVNRLLPRRYSTQLTDFFKSHKILRGLPVHDVIPISLSVIFILTSLNDTSAPRARLWAPAFMLHRANPCTEPRNSQPNKTKSKIYKTKSLGHYVTQPMPGPAYVAEIRFEKVHLQEKYTPTSYQTRKSNSDFCLNYCTAETHTVLRGASEI